MKKAIVFEAPRTGYSIEQIENQAITVRDLIELLEDFEDDTLVVLSHDCGYTFGSLDLQDCKMYRENESGEFEQED